MPRITDDESSSDGSSENEIPARRSKPTKEDFAEAEKEGSENSDDDEPAEDEYIVEAIEDHQFFEKELRLKVKWKGYEAEKDRTWEPEESLIDGAQEILEAYYTTIGGKPTLKAKGKRTRDSTGTPQTQSSGKGSKRIKQVDTNMEDARSTPETETKGNWKPPAGSWEDDIHCVDTIEMDKNDLYVYLQWNNGRKTRHQTREVYKKCPMRMLQFYESHLVFKEGNGPAQKMHNGS